MSKLNTFSEDFGRWIKLCKEFKLDVMKVNTKTIKGQLTRIQHRIIKLQDSALAYFCATEFPFYQYRMQEVILNDRNDLYAYLFARDVESSDRKALEKIVIKGADIEIISSYACNAYCVNLKKLENIIIESKCAKWIYNFIRSGKATDINSCKNVLLDTNKPRYLYEASKYASKEEVALIEDKLIELKSLTYIRYLAKNNIHCNIPKVERVVLMSGDTDQIIKFGKNIKNSRSSKLLMLI